MASRFEFDPNLIVGSGLITRGTAGEALARWQLVYQGANSRWYLADADLAATTPVIGLTLQAMGLGQNGKILLHGYIGRIIPPLPAVPPWNWTVGGSAGLIYASTTPGGLTQTPPAGPGDFVQVVAVATVSNFIYFNPFPPSAGLGAGSIKSRWYPAPNPNAEVGDHAGQSMMDNVDTYIRNEVYIPYNFHTLVACQVIVVQGTTATPNMVWTCDTDWGQICVGEDYLENSDVTGDTTQMSQDDLVCLDITAALTGIAAEDLVGVSFMRDGNNGADTVGGPVYYLGIRLRYT